VPPCAARSASRHRAIRKSTPYFLLILDLGGLVSRNTASNLDTSTGPGRSSQQPSTSFGSSLSETKLPPIHTLCTPASARFRIALLRPLNKLSRFAFHANLARISGK